MFNKLKRVLSRPVADTTNNQRLVRSREVRALREGFDYDLYREVLEAKGYMFNQEPEIRRITPEQSALLKEEHARAMRALRGDGSTENIVVTPTVART